MDLRTPSGRPIEVVREKVVRPRDSRPDPVPPISAEFETRKTLAEIANEKFVEALKAYFAKGGRA